MLFDLSGKRKRFIQVIYVFLALLMGVGLVGLGIGGDANGGIFNALGIGGDGSTDSDPEFDRQIERAEEDLASDPKDEKALLLLARTHFLKAQTQLEVDEQGNQAITAESETSYAEAIDAWERYLETKPEKPDDSVAGLILQAYGYTISLDDVPSELETSVDGAYEASRIIAEARPSFGTYLTLAQTAHFAGETKAAEEAEKNALKEAADPSAESQVKQQVAVSKQQAKLIQQRIEGTDAPAAEQANPLQGLGGAAPLPGEAPLPGTETTPPPDDSGTGAPAGGSSGSGDSKKK